MSELFRLIRRKKLTVFDKAVSYTCETHDTSINLLGAVRQCKRAYWGCECEQEHEGNLYSDSTYDFLNGDKFDFLKVF